MMTYSLRPVLACIALVPTLLLSATALQPASQARPAPASRADMPVSMLSSQEAAGARLTSEDLSDFLDGMLPASMAIADVAGAVVVVVQGDRVLLAQGYGYADMERRVPVSAERTLFRIASISKLFTWTAVMQQVEAGRLDLDGDINDYLDFRIDGYGGEPIRLRHLMTHTAGFEERIKGMAIKDVRELKPLKAVLRESIPARINPPGTIPAYSNYSASLAGYIVERVSGMSFQDYLEQRIFQPLRMRHATSRQPVPAALRAQLSKGYRRASDDPLPFEVIPDPPAGSLSATGTDMAQFMLAHLHGGIVPEFGESSRILKPQTVALMHTVAHTVAPQVDAMALGFYEQSRNGWRVIGHGGDLTAFHSDLLLIPAANVGIFISFNSSGKAGSADLRQAFYQGFMDRYFPPAAGASAAHPAAASSAEHARALAGAYQVSRRAERNLFSFAFMPGQMRASVTPEGFLQIAGLSGLNGVTKTFQEISPWLWQEVSGQTRLAVVRSQPGAIEYLAADGYAPIMVFQPVSVWKDSRWLVPALFAAAVVILAAMLGWIIGIIRRPRRAQKDATLSTRSARIRAASRFAGLSCCVFLALLGAFVALLSGSSWLFSSAATPFLRLVQLSGLLAVIGSVVAVIAAALSWREPGARLRSAGRTLLAAACVVCAYVVIAFHFLAAQLRY